MKTTKTEKWGREGKGRGGEEEEREGRRSRGREGVSVA